jgi:uncharacterized membrane protein
MANLLLVAVVTVLPWIEPRGGIPLGVAMGFDPLVVLAVTVAANCLVIVPGFIALDLLYDRWLSRSTFVRRQVTRVREKGKTYVERYELLGLAIFVAIPLPGTGAYAGTLLAWLLGLPRRRAAAAIALGVLGAGVIVTIAVSGIAAIFRRLQ